MNQPDPTQAWPVFVHPDMLHDLLECADLRSHATVSDGHAMEVRGLTVFVSERPNVRWMPRAFFGLVHSEPRDYWPPLRFSVPRTPLRELVACIRFAHT